MAVRKRLTCAKVNTKLQTVKYFDFTGDSCSVEQSLQSLAQICMAWPERGLELNQSALPRAPRPLHTKKAGIFCPYSVVMLKLSDILNFTELGLQSPKAGFIATFPFKRDRLWLPDPCGQTHRPLR